MRLEPDKQAERRMEAENRRRLIQTALPYIKEVTDSEIERCVRKMTAEETPTYDELLDCRAGLRICRRIAVNTETDLDIATQLARGDI